MSYNDFVKDIKASVPNSSLFFYGDEDFLMNWATETVINKYVGKDNRNIDVQHLDGGACSAEDIISATRAYSMFSSRRVVVVSDFKPIFSNIGTRGLTADEEALLEMASAPNDSSVLVFKTSAVHSDKLLSFGKKLMKACNGTYCFDRLDKATLKPFITKRIHSAGNMIGERDLDYLINLSGYFNKNSEYYLENLEADLLKINNAAIDSRVTKDIIDELLVGDDDKFVFNLIDAMMSGNKRTAMEITTAIIAEENNDAMMLLGLITKQLEMMYDAEQLSQKGMSVAQMAKATGVNEYRFKKAYLAARKMNIHRIKKMLMRLYNIDKDIKTGNIDKDTALELFVFEM